MYLIPEIHNTIINDNEILIINLINGATDIINKKEYTKLVDKNFIDIDQDIIKQLIKRRYLFNSIYDYKTFINNLEETIDKAESTGIPNFLIIPTYACNLNCTYCYEQSYEINHYKTISKQEFVIDKQFEFINFILNNIDSEINKKDVKITIMGGEPLLKKNIYVIRYILEKIQKENFSSNIITNGVEVDYFLDDLVKYNVNHLQITLDGSQNIHNKRRIFHNGAGSFNEIIENIGNVLSKGIKINLRVNVDKENINDLPELADILIEKFENNSLLNPYIYLLQDGGCSGSSNIVSEQIGIEEIYKLENENPNMKIFYKKFHPSSFLDSIFSNQKFYPSLRHCSASSNQYILDYKGNIYKCWHGIGNDNYSTGSFLGNFKLNSSLEKEWKKRTVNEIEECIACKYKYICGTGCPAAEHKGIEHFDLKTPYCVDYNSIMDTIVKKYLEKI